jgi:arginine utilization protein RocB
MSEMRNANRDFHAFAKRWAFALTSKPSVTGSTDEAAFGSWLADALRKDPAFAEARIWAFPVVPGDDRHCVAMLLRGRGAQTVILTGHYDTVTFDDYGDLSGFATRPADLAEALRTRLTLNAETPAEKRACADLASGEFLPGRGLLDMKSGLAAGLAVVAAFAAKANRSGNLLFIAVPDEEANSAGARCAARQLPSIASQHSLDFIGAVNLDAIADDGDGVTGRVIALGTVGKLLPTAFVVGVPVHSGFPLNGVNAAAVAAAIAARVEWASELTDESSTEPGTAPTLLSLRDGKVGYDVTAPATAFATFNVLNYRRNPAEVLERFDRLCKEAVSDHLTALRHRVKQSRNTAKVTEIPTAFPIYRYEAVEAAALARDCSNEARLRASAAVLARNGMSFPEQCRLMTAEAWTLSGLAGPAVVVGFGSTPYLPTALSDTQAGRRMRAAAQAAAATEAERHGTFVTCTDYFAGISDMSFFGEAEEADLTIVSRNTPLWREGVNWPDKNGLANIPTINIGPWGRDYHTPLERLHLGYAFNVVPRLIGDVVQALLVDDPE